MASMPASSSFLETPPRQNGRPATISSAGAEPYTPSIPPTPSVASASSPVRNRQAAAQTKWREATTRTMNPEVRSDIQRGVARRKWMDDSESEECLQCHKPFSVFRRRHHCRNCGLLVCNSCSQNTVKLPQTAASITASPLEAEEPVRVCDTCYDRLNGISPADDRMSEVATPVRGSDEKGSAAGGADGNGDGAADGDIVQIDDPRLKERIVPAWMYLFKPMLAKGTDVGIGRLFVKIVRAENLPALDFSGTSDPYAVIRFKEQWLAYDAAVLAGEKDVKEPQISRTKEQDKTLNPVWNESFILTVPNATYTLRVDLYDHDAVGDDEFMGSVDIPLHTLAHGGRVDQWFDVKLCEEAKAQHALNTQSVGGKFFSAIPGTNLLPNPFKRKERTTSSASNPAGDEDTRKPSRTKSFFTFGNGSGSDSKSAQTPDGKASKGGSKPAASPAANSAAANQASADQLVSLARTGSKLHSGEHSRVCLQLQFSYSKIGEFVSYFQPFRNPAPPPAPFNVDLLLVQAFRTLALLAPVFAALGGINTVLSWKRPLLSWAVLIIFVLSCFYPWVLPFTLQCLLIMHIVNQYTYRVWRQQEKLDTRMKELSGHGASGADGSSPGTTPGTGPSGANASKDDGKTKSDLENKQLVALSAAVVQSRAEASQEDPTSAEAAAENVQYLGGALRAVLNSTLSAAGWREYLHYYQVLLIWINDTIEMVYQLFEWKWPGTTKAILFILIATTLFTVFSSFSYILLVGGVYVLSMFTVPVQTALWILLSITAYFTRPRPPRRAVRKFDKTVLAATSVAKAQRLKVVTAAAAAGASATPDGETKKGQ